MEKRLTKLHRSYNIVSRIPTQSEGTTTVLNGILDELV